MNRILIVIFASLIFVACNSNTSKPNAEQQEIDNAYLQINELNQRAEKDSSFQNTPEYAAEMERKQIEIAKSMRGLSDNDKLLLKYELAIKDLELYHQRLKTKPDLSKNRFFMETFQKHGNTTRKIYQQLMKTTLNSEEKNRFNELTSNK